MVMPSKHFKKNTIGQTFNTATGRFASAAFGNYSFAYSYLANSNLISGMTTANGTAEKVFAYEANRDLPTEIKYQTTGETPALIAKRNYTFDALGRVSARSQARGNAAARNDSFGYNNRSELTSATLGNDDYAYAFDNIGNRLTSAEDGTDKNYASNQLNQYTAISNPTFNPSYDDDGNELTVRTGTGAWTIEYNAENRPVTFTQGTTVIECKYDSQGRRFEKKVTVNGTVTFWQRYAYRGYLQIAAFNVTLDETDEEVYTLATTTMWDPMEQTATRPLAFTDHTGATPATYFYTHDLTKNVCELLNATDTIVTTYDYTPFGAVTASNTATPNTFMFSSEVFDSEMSLVYYNYRHYNPLDGRWINRDPIGEEGGLCLYLMINNKLTSFTDVKGLLFAEGDPLGPHGTVDNILTGLFSSDQVADGIVNVASENDKTIIPQIHSYQPSYLAPDVILELFKEILGLGNIETNSDDWLSCMGNCLQFPIYENIRKNYSILFSLYLWNNGIPKSILFSHPKHFGGKPSPTFYQPAKVLDPVGYRQMSPATRKFINSMIKKVGRIFFLWNGTIESAKIACCLYKCGDKK